MRLANGREASALDIQCEYLNRALRYAEHQGLSPLEKQALEMWEHCLTQLEKDPLRLDRECDWVIKHKLIEALPRAHDLPLTHPKVALIDLQYHDVNRERGLFYKLQDAGLVERMCTDDDIDTAVDDAAADHPRPAARRVHHAGPRSASATTRSTGCT